MTNEIKLEKVINNRASTDRRIPALCVDKSTCAYFNALFRKKVNVQKDSRLSIFKDKITGDWHIGLDVTGTRIRINSNVVKIPNSFFEPLLKDVKKDTCKRISFYISPEPVIISNEEFFYINTKMPFNELY
jgi:hypothetical protein